MFRYEWISMPTWLPKPMALFQKVEQLQRIVTPTRIQKHARVSETHYMHLFSYILRNHLR